MTKTSKPAEPDYDAWAEKIERLGEDPAPAPRTGKGLSGKAAREYAVRMLAEAAETPAETAALEEVRALGGRPTLDPAGEASVAWRVRVPADLDT
ncbi:MAG: hypothetical protein ACRDTJ_23125, partial [Pseudonocardiaceae bacterium]